MSLVWYCPNNTSYGQVNRQANETASHHHHPTDVRYNLHLTSLNTCSFTAQLVELHDKTLLPRRGGLTDAYPSGPSGDQEGGLNINKNTNKQTSIYLYMYIIIHTYIHYITYIHIYIQYIHISISWNKNLPIPRNSIYLPCVMSHGQGRRFLLGFQPRPVRKEQYCTANPSRLRP